MPRYTPGKPSKPEPESRTIVIPWDVAFDALFSKGWDDLDHDLYDWVGDNVEEFVKEYIKSNFENEDEDGNPDIDPELEEAIRTACIDEAWGNASKDQYETRLGVVEDFIDKQLNHVQDNCVSVKQTKIPFSSTDGVQHEMSGFAVTVKPSFLEASKEIHEGYGFSEGDDERSLDDVTAATILSAAANVPEVYGTRSFSRYIDRAFERWEPSVGSYRVLRKVADKAVSDFKEGKKREAVELIKSNARTRYSKENPPPVRKKRRLLEID